MKIYQIVAAILLVTLGFLIAFFPDNVDHQLNARAKAFGDQFVYRMRSLEFLSKQKESLTLPPPETEADIKDLIKQKQDFCFGGVSSATMTPSQKLIAFIKGPCNPVLLVPGFMGTSLQVVVDCPTLFAQNLPIFTACGWETCDPLVWWKRRPASEYRLWISTVTSQTNEVLPSDTDKCFSGLITLTKNPKKTSVYDEYKDPQGLTVTWFGNTTNTASQSDCGTNAIQDISSSLVVDFGDCNVKAWHNTIAVLQAMGYQTGITLQALPYDWRLGLNNSATHYSFPSAIQQLYQRTGKRTFIISHSFGGMQTYYNLLLLESTAQIKYVALWMSIVNPSGGINRLLKNFLSGDTGNAYDFGPIGIGATYEDQAAFMKTTGSLWNMMPSDTFQRAQNVPWFEEIEARLKWEYQFTNNTEGDDIPLNFLPLPNMTCALPQFVGRTWTSKSDPTICTLGVTDFSASYLAQVQNRNYMANQQDMAKLLKLEAGSKQDGEDFLAIYNEQVVNDPWYGKMMDFTNIGIQSVHIYGQMITTPYQYSYANPTKNPQSIGHPDYMAYTVGDGVATTTSQILLPIKFIDDYKDKTDPVAQPTKMIQYCSLYNQTSTIYTEAAVDANNMKIITGAYPWAGLDCNCLASLSTAECSHGCILSDPKLVALIVDAVAAQETSQYVKTNTIPTYTDAQVVAMNTLCAPLLTNPLH